MRGPVTEGPTAEADHDAGAPMRRNREAAEARRVGGPSSSASSRYTLPNVRAWSGSLPCSRPSRRKTASPLHADANRGFDTRGANFAVKVVVSAGSYPPSMVV